MTRPSDACRRLRPLALVALVALAATLWNQRYRESLAARNIGSLLAEEGIAGAVLAVRQADGLTRVVTYGESAVLSTPLDANSVFPIASLSKPLTAAAVRQLVARGELGLDDPAIRWLPVLAGGRDPRLAQITVRQLLQHTSGLGGEPDPMFDGHRTMGCNRAIDTAIHRPLDREPGTHVHYSNVGYCLLGRLIERVTGREYADAVKQLLELPATAALTLGPPMAAPHEGYTLAGSEWSSLAAAGGWFSDAQTLTSIFSTDARDPTIPAPPPANYQGPYHYGLGWRIWPGPRPGEYRLSHFGILPGMFSLAVSYADGCSVVILTNGRPASGEVLASMLTGLLERELPHSRSGRHWNHPRQPAHR